MDTCVNELIQHLGVDQVLVGTSLSERYEHIWRMDQSLKAKALVLPRSTEEVSSIMKICHQYDQQVSIFGGLTNLTGATEVSTQEVVISLEKLNKIIDIDEQARTMTVETGVILESIQTAASDKDLLFPLNFGAKGSAQIGGIISTNAGGLRVLRFGMTRHLVLGLEVVLADGTILSSLKKIIKDNAGYDLKQLFIGSEGTLGIVTKAVLRLHELPKSRVSAFIGVNGYEKVTDLLKYMDKGFAGLLSGFELIWQGCYRAMTAPNTSANPPLPHDYEYYVLLEGLGSDIEKDKDRLASLLEEALEKAMIEDAVMAHTASDMDWFWKIREDVHAFVSKHKHQQHFDISMPIASIGRVVGEITEELAALDGVIASYNFGHVADSNIHILVGKESSEPALTEAVNQVVYSPLQALGGSVSAEHGIGRHKKQYLSMCRTQEEIDLMKTLKVALDPKGLLNVDRVF